MINRIKEYIVSCLIKVKRKYKIRQLKKYYKVDTTFFVEQLKKNIDGKKTLILTVSFNNEKVIEKQIELLSKFCKDEYIYLVADNSTILEKSNKIEKICHEGNVYYYRLPANNPFNNYDPSSSHGASLNYIWRNIISKLDNVDYIMMLDHDIFPTSFFSVKEMLKNQSFYGLVKSRKLGWYLWPGFSCFSIKILKEIVVDFLPSIYGDTGSSNYLSLYKNYDLIKIDKATDEYIELNIEDTDERDIYIDQKNRLELIDGHWIHLINAADWAGIGSMDEKFNKMMKIINKRID